MVWFSSIRTKENSTRLSREWTSISILQAVLQDILLLTGMALLGEFIDYMFFQKAIKKTKEDMLVEKTADATTAQVEEVIKKYIGRT